MIITIDGPAGSGKSTLAAMLANHFNLFYLNSGYLYRAVAYVLLKYYGYTEEALSVATIDDMKACMQEGNFVYLYEQGLPKVLFKDEDITQFLKDIDISRAAAALGQNKDARDMIRVMERYIGATNKDLVIDGRVAGSVIFPDADYKFYLIASQEVRAQRTHKLQQKRGKSISLQDVLQQLADRDQKDMNRSYDKLVKPEGAIEIDTSGLSKDQMFQEALTYM